MRNLHELNRWRVVLPDYGPGDGRTGIFVVPSPVDGGELHVVAANDAGWDHVSVSRLRRTPTWGEMDHVARLFFLATERAFQLHVPPAEHISYHPHTLHLWRCHDQEPPLPPYWMVGPKPGQSLDEAHADAARALGASGIEGRKPEGL